MRSAERRKVNVEMKCWRSWGKCDELTELGIQRCVSHSASRVDQRVMRWLGHVARMETAVKEPVFFDRLPALCCLIIWRGRRCRYMIRLGQTVKNMQLLNIKEQVPSILAKGCLLDNCTCVI